MEHQVPRHPHRPRRQERRPHLDRQPSGRRIRAFLLDRTEPLPLGAIVGTVTVVDVVPDSPSRWAEPDCLHWLLADTVRLEEPTSAIGRLGLWRIAPPEPAPALW